MFNKPINLIPGFFADKEKNKKAFRDFFEKHDQHWKSAIFDELVRQFEVLILENEILRKTLGETAYQEALKNWKNRKRD